jgi:O-antigen/teichoic acid export membrane protein
MMNRSLGVVRTIFLARLLSPTDFGLFGIALLSVSALDTFSQPGLQAALVQKKGDVNSFLDTAWTVAVLRGFLLFIALFLFAPLIADFFNSPQAMPVLRVLSISTILSGLKNIKLLFFQKELEFRKQFLYEFSATLVDLVVVVICAFILKNVWALVWGIMASNVVRVCLSYIIYPYRPRIKLERKKILSLLGFGKWIWGSTALIFFINQGDDVLLGKILGVTALGFYQMAYLLSNLPATEIAKVISKVTFPAYSKLQSDISRLREAYLKVLKLTSFAAIPLAGCIFALAPEFVQIFLGAKWKPIIPVVQVLVLAGVLRSLSSTFGPVLHGLGLPKIDTIYQSMRLIILVIFIYPFTVHWGMVGTSLSVLISIFISSFSCWLKILKITSCKLKDFSKTIIPPTINTVIMVSIILILKYNIKPVGIFRFIGFVMLYSSFYLVLAYLVDKYLNYGVVKLLKDSIA